MSNHLHAIVKTELATLSRAVKVINLRYAARYNRRYRRVSPVFGDRYRSEVIEDDAYLLGALRYIHKEPYLLFTSRVVVSQNEWGERNNSMIGGFIKGI